MNNSLIVTWICMVILTIFLTATIVVANMPYNPLKDKVRESSVVSLMPEAWSFFTRSPREAQLFIYQEQNGEIQNVSYSNPSPKSWFGLKRNVRIQAIELGNLFEKSQRFKWYNCESTLQDCQNWDTIPPQVIHSIAQTKTICGEYFLVSKTIIPWAWSKSSDEVNMPSRVTKINVLCSAE